MTDLAKEAREELKNCTQEYSHCDCLESFMHFLNLVSDAELLCPITKVLTELKQLRTKSIHQWQEECTNDDSDGDDQSRHSSLTVILISVLVGVAVLALVIGAVIWYVVKKPFPRYSVVSAEDDDDHQ